MEELTLSGLKYHAYHGFYKEEQEKGNDFEIDLIFFADLREAGTTDKLTDTIDYQQAEQIVRSVMEGPSVELIEKLAYNIGEKLFMHFGTAKKMTIRIRKLHPPLKTPAAYAQIVRTWTRS